jgi:hypothetical protein
MRKPVTRHRGCLRCKWAEEEARDFDTGTCVRHEVYGIFDVGLAKAIAHGRKPVLLTRAMMRLLAVRDEHGAVERHIAHVDPDDPLLVGNMGGWRGRRGDRHIILDGGHRFARHQRDGTRPAALMLTRRETRAVLMAGEWRQFHLNPSPEAFATLTKRLRLIRGRLL